MLKRSGFVAMILALALVATACGDDDSSLLDQAGTTPDSSSDVLDGVPSTIGNIPGVSGECEALLNLFLSMGGAFLGGEIMPLDAGALGDLPPDVRADAILMSETLREFSEGMQELGVDFSDPSSFATLTPAQQEALNDLSDSLDTEEFNRASDNVSEYGDQQCGDQFDATG